uniref:PH01B001I13.14 protein n=1 Tax=Phyllostachys edulis TaxID=38705 RepID=L0P3Q0_PHYED|nr:PH01B001I13.14 [Phyllostachys edulis]
MACKIGAYELLVFETDIRQKDGPWYFLLLVDDFSRVMWVYMLQKKEDAKVFFHKFVELVETQNDHKLKAIRSYRGGEFLSSDFGEIFDQKGITRYFTAPYSPQQNGVIERRNRTVMDMARSFLKSKMMSCKLWAEAVRHSVYILNRIQTKALDGMTPYEAWSGRKPSLEHMRIFGCIAHAKNYNQIEET